MIGADIQLAWTAAEWANPRALVSRCLRTGFCERSIPKWYCKSMPQWRWRGIPKPHKRRQRVLLRLFKRINREVDPGPSVIRPDVPK